MSASQRKWQDELYDHLAIPVMACDYSNAASRYRVFRKTMAELWGGSDYGDKVLADADRIWIEVLKDHR